MKRNAVFEDLLLSTHSLNRAIVETGRARILAFRDANGAWRDAFHPEAPPLAVFDIREIERAYLPAGLDL